MADPFAAGKALGSALFDRQQDTYDQTVKGAYDTERALQQARQARSLALIDAARESARTGLTPDLLGRFAAGAPDAQAEVLSRVLGGNQTLDLDQLGKFQTPHFGEATNTRFEALGLGTEAQDPALANRATAFTQGTDYQPTRVLGGAYVPDAVSLDQAFTMVPTPATAAQIDATERRADAAVRRADRPASTRVTAPKADKPPSAAQAESAILQQAREAIAKGAKPAAVKQRLKDKGYSKLAERI